MDEKKYQLYDYYVEITLINLYSLSKAKERIVLKEFDPDSKEHLFVYHVALIARDMYGWPLYIDCGRWKLMKLNHQNRKFYHRSKKAGRRKLKGALSVSEMLGYEKETAKMHLGDNFSFADIYEEYYERKE